MRVLACATRACHSLLSVLPLKKLREPETLHFRELRDRDIGTLEIKKRGVDVDPAQLRTRLRLSGAGSATLILTRVAGDRVALLARREPGDAA